MHPAVYHKGLTEWCWWCKFKREVIMCISAFRSLPIGCFLFRLKTRKYGRRYIWPGSWAEHLASLSLPNVQYLCTVFAAHRLSGLTAISQRRAYLKPIQAYLSCKKMERGTGSWENEVPPKSQTQHLMKVLSHHDTRKHFCPAPEGWTARGWAVIAWWQKWTYDIRCMRSWLEPSAQGQAKLVKYFPHSKYVTLEKKNLMLGSFLCLGVFGFWAKMTNCFWVSFVAF